MSLLPLLVITVAIARTFTAPTSLSPNDLLISPSDGVTVAIPEDDYDEGFFKAAEFPDISVVQEGVKLMPLRATPIPHSPPRLRDHTPHKRESRGPSSDLISDIFYMTTVDNKMDDLLERMDEMKDLLSRSLSVRKTTRRELLSQILTASQEERNR